MNVQLKTNVENTINTIFSNLNVNNLTPYQKRKAIYSFLCDNLSYDFDLLSKIKSHNVNKTPISRDLINELNSVAFNRKGVCNAISQYYKLLLEQVNIKSYCVICDDGTPVAHQLCLVYDNENKVYSFDDITSVITNSGTKEEFFDYNLKYANLKSQGNKPLIDNQKFVILPEDYLNYLFNREHSFTEEINTLPQNIYSVKELTKNYEIER